MLRKMFYVQKKNNFSNQKDVNKTYAKVNKTNTYNKIAKEGICPKSQKLAG